MHIFSLLNLFEEDGPFSFFASFFSQETQQCTNFGYHYVRVCNTYHSHMTNLMTNFIASYHWLISTPLLFIFFFIHSNNNHFPFSFFFKKKNISLFLNKRLINQHRCYYQQVHHFLILSFHLSLEIFE